MNEVFILYHGEDCPDSMPVVRGIYRFFELAKQDAEKIIRKDKASFMGLYPKGKICWHEMSFSGYHACWRRFTESKSKYGLNKNSNTVIFIKESTLDLLEPRW